ncbi:alpha/beta hydrolase [Amycolatopsis saalfeldensis]|uniref:Alpha/beta hydrolase fold n=1 Tax=Amycolatopsis saalfeldensis TaxID=394193 RepID=A0A1H8YQJ6_9PSEU|nr:alpha/beta hydrolase [Amycolatopsis saalfeldensis]SEP54363.1 alpha/beta hydrolase fold [Amycolatopsis saalfeldensis]
MRRLRFALVVPLAVVGLIAGMTPASAAPLNTTNIPDRYTGQSLGWVPCAAAELTDLPPGTDIKDLECGAFRTPRDWDRPDERQDLTIAVSRLRSTGATTASVLTNPGGPGGPGRWFPVSLRGQSRLREHQEIIGVDTRGTGKSTNVTCGGAGSTGADLDPRDRDPRNLNLIVDAVQYVANSCRTAAGELGPLISTFQNVKDLDLLRVLLGRAQVNWIGYSAGTWLGAHYAQQFPQRTGRFVLDSSTEFTTSWQNSFNWQPAGYERRWRQDFLPWMARYDAKYHFGANGEAARQTYESLRYALSRNPLEVNGSRVGPTTLDNYLIGSLKAKVTFPQVAETLVTAKTLVDGRASEQATGGARTALKTALSEKAPGPLPDPGDASDSMLATLFTTLCNDGPWQGDRQSLIRRSQQYLDRGVTLYSTAWMPFQVCAFWTGSPRPLPVMDGKGVPPVLMVQSEHDPATPIEGARKAHAAFANSRMITVTGEGDHGIYALGGNQAVDKVVEDYLVDGVVPQDQSVPGLPLPVP